MNYTEANYPTSRPLRAGDTVRFGFTGTYKSILLAPGTYSMECIGAGGNYAKHDGGLQAARGYGYGAYVSGVLRLRFHTVFYVFVGEQGKLGNNAGVGGAGGWNGGGTGGGDEGNDTGGGGGGASEYAIDIIVNATQALRIIANNQNALYALAESQKMKDRLIYLDETVYHNNCTESGIIDLIQVARRAKSS